MHKPEPCTSNERYYCVTVYGLPFYASIPYEDCSVVFVSELILFSWGVGVQSSPPQASSVNLMLCTWSDLPYHPPFHFGIPQAMNHWRWDEDPGNGPVYVLIHT